MGKHSLLDSPALREAVVAAIRKGMSPRSAMLALGMHKDLISRYGTAVRNGVWGEGGTPTPATLEILTQFLAEIEQARAEFEQDMIEGIYEDANRLNERTGQRDWRARAWLVERNAWTREHWHPYQEPQQINLKVTQDLPPEFREAKDLTDAELIDGIDDPEWAKLLRSPPT